MAKTSVVIKEWRGPEIHDALVQESVRRVHQACIIIRDNIKRLINTGGIQSRDSRGRYRSGYASQPGHPPRKQSGRLFRSITAPPPRVGGGKIIGEVGTNVEYAMRLEYGFTGVDALGRRYSQAPRPFLRPGLEQSMTEVRQQTGLAFRVE